MPPSQNRNERVEPYFPTQMFSAGGFFLFCGVSKQREAPDRELLSAISFIYM